MVNKDSTRYKSSRHEGRSSKRFQSKLTPNSGAIDSDRLKGDHQSDHYFFECKSTKSKSFGLSVDLIEDTMSKANKVSKHWILDIEFQGEHPDQVVSNVVVMDPNTFKDSLPLNRDSVSVKDFLKDLISVNLNGCNIEAIADIVKSTKHLSKKDREELIKLIPSHYH